MDSIDVLITARWVIPVEPRGIVLDDHAVAVANGNIVAVGPSDELASRFSAKQTLALADHALIPGLVNAHTHAAMSLFRGLADDLPLMEWLEGHIWPAEARVVDASFVRDGTRLAIAEMLRGGTTCFNDMYFYPDETAKVCVEAGMRACVGMIVIDFPTVWAKDANDYIAKGTSVHDEFRNEELIETVFAPHAPYTVSDAPLERIRVLADELDVPIHMHVHETRFEVETAVQERGQRPLARLDKLGLLNPRLLAVHATQLEAAEIDRLATTGVHVVHCPESNLKLASGFCPVASLRSAGVNVAVGTDGAASNNDLSMFGEMRTGSLLAKAVDGRAEAIPASVALEMATLGGARALGLDEKIGSLEVGKAADIVAVDLSDLATQPIYEPISTLVYAASAHQVSDVWVAGRRVLQSGALRTLSAPDLVAQAQSWARRIKDGS